MRRLHEKLRIAAKAKKLRVADVARLMPEVAASAVGHWFTGKRKPQLDHLHRLAEILEVSAAALVADDPDYAQTSEERIAARSPTSSAPSHACAHAIHERGKEMKAIAIALIAMLLNGCATMPSSMEMASADYGQPIAQADAQAQAEAFIAKQIKDPYSAKYDWQTISTGYCKDSIMDGGHVYYGWRLVGGMNSKNSFGAYVGATPVQFIFHDGRMVAGYRQKRIDLGGGDGVNVMGKIF